VYGTPPSTLDFPRKTIKGKTRRTSSGSCANGERVECEYVEHENGGKGVEYRKQLGAMCTGAARREFNLLLVWAPDRLSLEGISATVGHLQRLASYGVAFRSFTEEHLSTENELVRNILLATLASLAKSEREKISQRTKAGLERAPAMGKVLGRPKFSDGGREKLRAALDGGKSWHAGSIATRLSILHGREARPSTRLRAPATGCDVGSERQKPAWLRADPSGFTSPRFTFLKPRVPLRARSISKFGTLGPSRASSLFGAPAICWPRWVPRCLLLSSWVVRRRCTGRVAAFDGSPFPLLPPGTPLHSLPGRSLVGVEDRLIDGDDKAAERRRFQHISDHSDEIDFRFAIGRAMARIGTSASSLRTA
jgi:DNA invertase Pin-like site-specific DNA recombinase